ncbi:SMC-Scp complex subunit ScpB [Kribbella jiaozuonensis]|uniref:SMC-Scp complex subunit ScpB n=1 Tax=Kribbella jiaozuonensis TaxID=2575441 RepID=UPI002685D456|nr:SMC-Scp complex subunit ScpB [Kribbella jiaozuonensis]
MTAVPDAQEETAPEHSSVVDDAADEPDTAGEQVDAEDAAGEHLDGDGAADGQVAADASAQKAADVQTDADGSVGEQVDADDASDEQVTAEEQVGAEGVTEHAAEAAGSAQADEQAAEDEQVGAEEHAADAESSAEEAADAEGSAGGVLVDEEHLPPGQTEVPVGDEVVVDDDTMRRAIEAILMVTDEPLPVLTLARAVGRPTTDVANALGTLAEEYTEQGRGFDLREVGGGWRYYTRAEAAPYVERFVLDGQQARLTQAALETLSVVAYKQPVSRARVSAIRGVNVDGVMRTLVARGLVEEAGADTESQATLYRTTTYFLERMGMQSLDDLPELAPYLPDMDDIEDELAAQSLPPAPSPDEATSTTAEDSPQDADSTETPEPDESEQTALTQPADDAEHAEPEYADHAAEPEYAEPAQHATDAQAEYPELAQDTVGMHDASGDDAQEAGAEVDDAPTAGAEFEQAEYVDSTENAEQAEDIAEAEGVEEAGVESAGDAEPAAEGSAYDVDVEGDLGVLTQGEGVRDGG